jgi:hypothetical protein
MYVTRLEIEGLRSAEHRTVESSDRTVSVGAGAEGGAVFDALDLFAGALSPRDPRAVVRRLGWDGDGLDVVGDDAEPEIVGLSGAAVGASLAEGTRSVTIQAEIELDPPLYARLRDVARDPRVLLALGQRRAIAVKAGWLFNKDRSAAHPSVLAFRIGDVAFDTVGKERPAWLGDICSDIGARFARTDPTDTSSVVATRLLAAWVSPDAAQRSGYLRLSAAVERAPFEVPSLGVVRHGERLEIAFGKDLTPARMFGRQALDAVRWCEALFVRRPDVLAIEEPIGEAVATWLTSVVEGPDAPIEQVWLR